jgi:hypothetical protein
MALSITANADYEILQMPRDLTGVLHAGSLYARTIGKLILKKYDVRLRTWFKWFVIK